jgi:hypothetical protein
MNQRFSHRRSLQNLGWTIAAIVAVAAMGSQQALATGNVPMALDGMIVNNTGGGQSGWGGFGRFTYGGMTVGDSATLGRYGAFTVSEPGAGGSGVGINFAISGSPTIDSPTDLFAGPLNPVTADMFPLLDRGAFGINFDPTQYAAELVYKPLAGNTATQLNMTLDTTDGFIGGQRAGEQWQWGFTDLLTRYDAGTKDADGFVTVRNNDTNGDGTASLSQADSFFHGDSFILSSGQNTVRDNTPDFNNFQGDPLPVPNGAVQIHLQTVFGTGSELVDNWEIKALRVVKLNPDPREVARLDGHSGFSQRFNSPFQRNTDTPINIGGTDYLPPATDQVSRFDQNGFTNIVINTDDDQGFGGLGLFQSAATTVFDGTNATVEVRAKLTQPQGAGEADHIILVVKDKDGNGTGGSDLGGDEYHYSLPLNDFNTSTMTTVSIPLSAFTAQVAQEFANPGDGLLTNFNLYYLGLLTDQGAGLVDMDIESIRVLLPGLSGDLNGDGRVDGADFLQWQRTGGSPEDLAAIRTNFGMTSSSAAAAAIPEPTAAFLFSVILGALAISLRRGAKTPALAYAKRRRG